MMTIADRFCRGRRVHPDRPAIWWRARSNAIRKGSHGPVRHYWRCCGMDSRCTGAPRAEVVRLRSVLRNRGEDEDLELFPEAASHQVVHDFIGAASDRAEGGIAPDASYRIFVPIPRSAMELARGIAGFPQHFGMPIFTGGSSGQSKREARAVVMSIASRANPKWSADEVVITARNQGGSMGSKPVLLERLPDAASALRLRAWRTAMRR